MRYPHKDTETVIRETVLFSLYVSERFRKKRDVTEFDGESGIIRRGIPKNVLFKRMDDLAVHGLVDDRLEENRFVLTKKLIKIGDDIQSIIDNRSCLIPYYIYCLGLRRDGIPRFDKTLVTFGLVLYYASIPLETAGGQIVRTADQYYPANVLAALKTGGLIRFCDKGKEVLFTPQGHKKALSIKPYWEGKNDRF